MNHDDIVQIAVTAAGAQGYMDHLTKVAGVDAEDVASAINAEKGGPAVMANAMALLAQNNQKPGGVTVGGQQHDLDSEGSGEDAEAKEAADLIAATAPYASISDYIAGLAFGDVKTASQLNEKVACISGCGDGCDLCGMSSEMKLAEAIEASNYIEQQSAILSGLELAKFAEDGVQAAQSGMDHVNHEALMAGLQAAKDNIDAQFHDLIFDNPKDTTNFGGSTMESNPVLGLLKPNYTAASPGPRQ